MPRPTIRCNSSPFTRNRAVRYSTLRWLYNTAVECQELVSTLVERLTPLRPLCSVWFRSKPISCASHYSINHPVLNERRGSTSVFKSKGLLDACMHCLL